MFQRSGEQRFRGDDGSADPSVTAALSAFARGEGSEHAALTALAAGRLLVPVVAALATAGDDADARTDHHADPTADAPAGTCHPAAAGHPLAGEKASEMAMPTLLGRDGRPAIPAFTGLDALARWQPAARPIPVGAALIWQAAVQDSCAVIIDVAGPVPLAVEGAALAALAAGAPVPPPQEDPDIRDAVAAALAASAPGPAAGAACVLWPGRDGSDLLLELSVPAGLDQRAADDLAGQLGSLVLEGLGGRLRRGLEIIVTRRAAGGPARRDRRRH